MTDDNGGYVYVSNSEISNGNGGVYGIYFNKDGQIINYKRLLHGTSRNCGVDVHHGIHLLVVRSMPMDNVGRLIR